MPTAAGETLSRLADQALHEGRRRARYRELVTPILVLLDHRGQTFRHAIAIPNTRPSEVMKVLLYAHQATHAAICWEGWAVEAQPLPDGVPEAEAMREVRAGRMPPGMLRPSQHPDRYDVLCLLAEGPDDQLLYRQWRIANTSPRTFGEEAEALEDQGAVFSSFHPMFPTEAEVVRIARRVVNTERLLAQTLDRRS
jgi:hypothetical protein